MLVSLRAETAIEAETCASGEQRSLNSTTPVVMNQLNDEINFKMWEKKQPHPSVVTWLYDIQYIRQVLSNVHMISHKNPE